MLQNKKETMDRGLKKAGGSLYPRKDSMVESKK